MSDKKDSTHKFSEGTNFPIQKKVPPMPQAKPLKTEEPKKPQQ